MLCQVQPLNSISPPPTPDCRFGIGIFYVLLYMLLKVAFDSEGWLVQIGNVVQLLYLFLIIVQVGGWVPGCGQAGRVPVGRAGWCGCCRCGNRTMARRA